MVSRCGQTLSDRPKPFVRSVRDIRAAILVPGLNGRQDLAEFGVLKWPVGDAVAELF